ncbi:MAG TPA: hypothetical protein VFA94_16320 [Acidimicrobiales bacterium]|nr:hypothetical protein [Acidimicrobiales bacterium]
MIPVILHDFTVDIGQPSTTSRDVVIRLTNHGPTTHELNVVRTDHPANALPLRADGLTVDDASPAIHHVAEAEGLDIGDHRTLRLHLTPGRYVFYCNMEGHYPGRMFTSFEVQA